MPSNDSNCVNTEFSSSNRITVTDEHAQSQVHPNTVELSPFQDVEDIEFEDICVDNAPDRDIVTLRAIAALRSGLDFSKDSIPTNIILIVINSITSQAITPAEQALGKFTPCKLKNMDTWNNWESWERKQLNQSHDFQIFGEDIARPPKENAVIFQSLWQYYVKQNGQRRDWQQKAWTCYIGSKQVAPILHALAKSYSSCCVEHPIQCQFLVLAADQNYRLFGGRC